MSERAQKDKPVVYLSTGIQELDSILSMSEEKIVDGRRSGGFLIGRGERRSELETPIILISGATGTGKTTLALQIAFNAAREKKWLPCFYTLEQTALSLQNLAFNFGGFEDFRQAREREHGEVSKMFCNLADAGQGGIDFGKNIDRIHLCHLSPRPISEVGNQDVFERRFAELRHMVETVSENVSNETFVVFFIDSINAFSLSPLSRNEIHRIFSLFRSNHILAILTMEHHQGYYGGAEYSSLECAKFLSDIVISLEKDSSKDYLLHFLEIEKSRVSRQVLGKHLYKIRTYKDAASIRMDPRTGIVLYPSIHSVLSRVTTQRFRRGPQPKEFIVCERDDDLWRIILTESIKAGECLAIVGPPGTHKLALGMNLSTGHSKDSATKLLIVNFGGSGDFRFRGVAWTKNREGFGELQTDRRIKAADRHMKFWQTDYHCGFQASREEASATIITFKIGQVAPEECFHIIDKIIEKSAKDGVPFSSVLLSDAAELCSGFPLLAADPLFLPALVDLFATRNLVSVCIGVDIEQPIVNAEINFSLLSRADYRIVMSHYPEKPELYEDIIRGQAKSEEARYLKEQLVCLVIDNVSGKHYGREPRWLWVEQVSDTQKVLHCDRDPHLVLEGLGSQTYTETDD